MFFYMPAKVYLEENCVLNHAKELCSLGSKALIVTGRRSAAANGSLDDVLSALSAGNVASVIFNEVEENPSVETIMKARDLGVAEKTDFVIGIGGGSAMDAAKAIAMMIRHADAGWEYLYDGSQPSDTLPIVEVPTTSGTGSEATAVSILTRKDTMTKGSIPHKFFSTLSLCDGKYLKSAPYSVLANTTMDALAHLLESAVNSDATDYSRMCAFAGLEVWKRSKEVLEKKLEPSMQDYENMMSASMLAGMAIAHTGTSLPHGMSYAVTVHAGMPHGKACGFFLPAYMKEADQELAADLLSRAGFTDADDLERYYQATCGRDIVSEDVLLKAVGDLLTHPEKQKKAPFHVDEKVLRRMAGLD